jgi:hypothetical protein
MTTFLMVPQSIGRCGSRWLGELLDSHPAITCLDELFNEALDVYEPIRTRLGDSRDPGRIYAEIRGTFPDSVAWGFKVFEAQIGPGVLDPLLAHVDRVVLIDRSNLTEAAVSMQMAANSGVWHHRNGEAVRQARTETLRVDITKALNLLRWAKERRERMASRVTDSGTPALEVCYESLRANPSATLDGVVDFLGIPASPVPLSATVRKAREDYAFVLNRDEVNDALGEEFGYLSG